MKEASGQQPPHGPMRRKEREITGRAEMDEILNGAKTMCLALADGGVPFAVPVCYAFDGTHIYFHSATSGTKIGILKRNRNVCFVVSGEHDIIESDAACDFEMRHRTVIGHGTAAFVEEPAEKVKALDLIVGRFTEKKFEYSGAELLRTAVIRIDIASMKGKKHGY